MQTHQTIIASDNASNFILKQGKLFLGRENNLSSPIHLIKYDQNQYDDQLYPFFKVKKPAQLDSWVSKRKAQFLSGRTAASKALYSHPLFSNRKVKEENKPLVSIGKSREPIWPNGFIGSISHSDDISIATAQPKDSSILGIGLDIQSILSEQEILHISQTALTDSDQLLIQKGTKDLSRSQLLTLMFSAKESFFKAAFNSVEDYFDFDTVTVCSITTGSQQLTLKSNVSLNHSIRKGDEFKVTYKMLDAPATSVITYCLISTD